MNEEEKSALFGCSLGIVVMIVHTLISLFFLYAIVKIAFWIFD